MKIKPTHENPANNHTTSIETMIKRNIILSKWQFVAASTAASILLLASSSRAERTPEGIEYTIGKGDETPAMIEKNKQEFVQSCIAQMTGPDGTGRAMAFQALQNNRVGQYAKLAVPALTDALKHKDSYVRIQSAYTLWKIDQRASAIEILSTELNGKANKAKDRVMAANFLGLVGADAKAALPSLVEATKDQDAEIRVTAAYALWTIDKRSDEAKPILIEGLKQPDLYAYSIAAWALGEIGFDKTSLIALNEAMSMEPKNYARASVVDRVIPALTKALGSDDAEIRKEAITVMGLMSNTFVAFKGKPDVLAAIPAITKALNDEDPMVSAKAAELLKKIGHKAADAPNIDK